VSINLQAPSAAPQWFSGFFSRLRDILVGMDKQAVKFLRYDFDKTHAGTTISLGSIPANAVVLPAISGVLVHEVFNAGTNNRFNMGTAASTTLYGSAKTLLALGFVPLTAAVLYRPSQTVATEMKIVVDVTGAAATTGKATAIIAYMVSQGV
jgi:hypothetical protein